MVKIDTKKLLFTLSGLGMVLLITIFLNTYNANASVKEGQKYGDWIVDCEKGTKGKKTCFLSQLLTLKSDSDKEAKVVANFRIGYFESKTLKMLQILPLGVNLQSGTSIILDESKLIAPGKFTICQNMGCIAIAELTNEDTKNLLAKEAAIVAIVSEGKQINLTFSTKGLKDGIAALK